MLLIWCQSIERATQMATTRQTAANRRNATRSTGPRTAAGRAISRRNALKHGLTAQEVAHEEEAQKFEAFRGDIIQELAPEGVLEEELGQRIVICFWRLRRIARLETVNGALLDSPSYSGADSYTFIREGQLIIRYEVALERMLQRALHELERLQARRRGEAVAAPIAVDVTHSLTVGPQDVTQQPLNGNPSVATRLPVPT
jgi:hypothetical protein